MILLNDAGIPEFIHLDTLQGLSDEITLQSACQFALHFATSDLRFACFTSTDYTEWMSVLEFALQSVIRHLEGNHSFLSQANIVLEEPSQVWDLVHQDD